jgi:hypothetical protein
MFLYLKFLQLQRKLNKNFLFNIFCVPNVTYFLCENIKDILLVYYQFTSKNCIRSTNIFTVRYPSSAAIIIFVGLSIKRQPFAFQLTRSSPLM